MFPIQKIVGLRTIFLHPQDLVQAPGICIRPQSREQVLLKCIGIDSHGICQVQLKIEQ